MKVNLISAVLLFALAGCGKDKQSTDELVTINVNKDYPEKELILSISSCIHRHAPHIIITTIGIYCAGND